MKKKATAKSTPPPNRFDRIEQRLDRLEETLARLRAVFVSGSVHVSKDRPMAFTVPPAVVGRAPGVPAHISGRRPATPSEEEDPPSPASPRMTPAMIEDAEIAAQLAAVLPKSQARKPETMGKGANRDGTRHWKGCTCKQCQA